MTVLEQIKIFYVNNEQDEFLKYEILADHTGRPAVALVYISLQHQVGQLSYAVWTKIAELNVASTEEKAEEALKLAMQACVDHRAGWQK